MRTVDDLLEQAKRLPIEARKELRDRLDASLQAPEEPSTTEEAQAGPYASLLKSAGTALALAPDVSRHKQAHLADIYSAKPGDR